ncbi:putative splicing factor 3A subunit 1 [Panicum miliaceum]|uniref:Splicing factor 3A subunit 1 n=1 Tax=Panicum miliaceum TaxID=4540 RepID=A0A3L6Q709_PANMI|nr:putative splicing factor 3A subunit 1 [Panicum miliaceum]
MPPMVNHVGIPQPPAPPLPPQPPAEEQPPPPDEPEPKRQRADDASLIPAEQFLTQHPGPASISVSVPNLDEGNLRGQVLEIRVQSLSDTVGSLKEQIAGELQLPANKQKLSILLYSIDDGTVPSMVILADRDAEKSGGRPSAAAAANASLEVSISGGPCGWHQWGTPAFAHGCSPAQQQQRGGGTAIEDGVGGQRGGRGGQVPGAEHPREVGLVGEVRGVEAVLAAGLARSVDKLRDAEDVLD